MPLTDDEKENLAAIVALRTQKEVEETFGKRFEALSQTITHSYETDRTALRAAAGLIGGALSIALGIIGFLGVKTWSDIETKITETVQRRLDSDVVLQAYARQVEELKIKVIVGRIERELLLAKQQGATSDDFEFTEISEDELRLFKGAIDSGSSKSRDILDVLRSVCEGRFVTDSDDSSQWQALVASISKSRSSDDPGARKSAWGFFADCPFPLGRELLVDDLRRLYSDNQGQANSARELRDNAPNYLLKVALTRQLSPSIRDDITAAASRAIQFESADRRFPVELAKAVLDVNRGGATAKLVSATAPTPAVMGFVTDPDVMFGRTPKIGKDLHDALNSIFKKWLAETNSERVTIALRTRARWKRLASNEEFYKEFCLRLLQDHASEPDKVARVIRTLFDLQPRRTNGGPTTALFVELPEHPRLRVVGVVRDRLRLEDRSTILIASNLAWVVEVNDSNAAPEFDLDEDEP